MSRLVLLIAAALVGYILWHYLRAKAKKEGRQAYWKAGLMAAAVALILLAATGRLHVLVAVAGAALALVGRLAPLARYWPLFRQLYGRYKGANPNPGQQQSRVRTTWLEMRLDHASGEMDGDVLTGALNGRQLSSLSQAEFIALCAECREHDTESLRLLAAWVARAHSEWSAPEDGNGSAGNGDTEMNLSEAREVLGLAAGASREDIIAAHRRLMARMHPDKGGSDYLASKINQARDLLLRETA